MIAVDANLFGGEVVRLKKRFHAIEQTRANGTAKDNKRFKDSWNKRVSHNVGSYWKKENDK